MKQLILSTVLAGIEIVIGANTSNTQNGTANAQFAPPSGQSDGVLWFGSKFGESGWFLHANNGSVRVCNMNKLSILQARLKYIRSIIVLSPQHIW